MDFDMFTLDYETLASFFFFLLLPPTIVHHDPCLLFHRVRLIVSMIHLYDRALLSKNSFIFDHRLLWLQNKKAPYDCGVCFYVILKSTHYFWEN